MFRPFLYIPARIFFVKVFKSSLWRRKMQAADGKFSIFAVIHTRCG